ncbi:MAG: FG-GAP repeat protein [Promethearchaeota archaeon]|jgi:hypothetical protein
MIIFRKNGSTWVQEAKLIPFDRGQEGFLYFGEDVSLDGDYAVIGAVRGYDDYGFETGAVYVFKRQGSSWYEQVKLLASDGKSMDNFGCEVSIDGDYLLVGANNDDNINGNSSGSVYIFKQLEDTWIEQAKLITSDGEESDWFGMSAYLKGDYAIISTLKVDGPAYISGSAYIFKNEGDDWIEQVKLIPPDNESEALFFGSDVTIDGEYAVIGACGDDSGAENAGVAYVFKQIDNEWMYAEKLVASDAEYGDFLGRQITQDRNRIAFGVSYNEDHGEYTGSAYVFQYNQEPVILHHGMIKNKINLLYHLLILKVIEFDMVYLLMMMVLSIPGLNIIIQVKK